MTDISHTIKAKSNQLNAHDLIGGPVTLSIISVKVANGDQPITINLKGDYQPFKPCLTVRRILAKIWGLDSSKWTGQEMTLYCDETIMWAGEQVGGIRISHVTGITNQIEVIARKSKHKVMKYVINPIIKNELKSLPVYSTEKIMENTEKWKVEFDNGKSPEALIIAIQQKFTLSNDQQKLIKEISAIK